LKEWENNAGGVATAGDLSVVLSGVLSSREAVTSSVEGEVASSVRLSSVLVSPYHTHGNFRKNVASASVAGRLRSGYSTARYDYT